MKKTILTYGLISGAICSALMDLATVFGNRIGFDHSMLLGYTIIVLSFLLVFFGIRSYRQEAGGTITFGRAFGLGISITLITCVCYVVTWEIVYYFFMPDFMDKYGAYVMEKARAAGASAAALQAKAEEMRRAKAMYANPLINAAMTFIEPFPVGLLITLISAAVLRKKPTAQAAEPAVAIQN